MGQDGKCCRLCSVFAGRERAPRPLGQLGVDKGQGPGGFMDGRERLKQGATRVVPACDHEGAEGLEGDSVQI